MLTTIRVTQKHIEQGQRCVCSECPIALAILDTLLDTFYCKVKATDIRIKSHGTGLVEYVAPLPPEASLFVFYYDQGETVVPFSFHLDIPDKYLKEASHDSEL